MSEDQKHAEAVYYSALASLDELPTAQQMSVALNWVKYVTMKRAWLEPKEKAFGKFRELCVYFAHKTLAMPDIYSEEMAEHDGTEECAHCAATKRSFATN